MTVKELINKLSEQNPDANVYLAEEVNNVDTYLCPDVVQPDDEGDVILEGYVL